MHGANGVVSQVLRVALQLCVPCQMEFLDCIQGTNILSVLHMVERDVYLLLRRDRPKYRVPWRLPEKCPRHEHNRNTESHPHKPHIAFAGHLFACRIKSHSFSIAAQPPFCTDSW